MKMFKKAIAFAAMGATVLSLAACGSSESGSTNSNGDEVTKISLYSNGSQNVEMFWEKVVSDFEKENKNIDVDFVFVPSGTGGQATIDKIVAAKKSGKDSKVDLYEGQLADIVRSNEEGGLFYSLDETGIPNLKNVQEANMKGTNNIAVPYRAASVVLAYNSEKVKDVPNTADEMYQWIKDHPGRFAYNDPSTGGSGSSFVLSTIYNQLPADAMNSQDESIMKDWNKGFGILKDLAPHLYKEGVYPKKNQGTLDLLANGEVDMIPVWSDMALEQLNKKLLPESTKLKQIDPAFTGGPSYMMAPDNGDEKRKEAAQTFMNYILTKEVQQTVMDQMYGYPGIKWEHLSKEDQERFADVSGGYRIFNGGALSEELTKQWQREIPTR